MSGLSRRVSWYASRLRAMEQGELAFRFGETLRRRAYRRNRAGWADFTQIGDGPIGTFPVLAERLVTAQARCADILDMAEAEFRNEAYSFLGQTPVELYGDDGAVRAAFWFTDPVSGAVWPGRERAAFSIPVRWTGADLGDVKFVWEPNRLQFLQPLAAVVAARQDDVIAERVLHVVRAWARANPPGRGVNWISGLELALRLVSLAVIIAGLGEKRLCRDDRILIRRLAAAHGRQIAAFPSRFSSANNHLVAEGLGLLVASQLAPDLPDARIWARKGRAIIAQETLRQIYPDGVGVEQSPTYHAFTLEMIALALLVTKGTALTFPAAVMDRLAMGARFLLSLADETGHVPAIGDDDEGHVLANTLERETRYPVSVAAAVLALSETPAAVETPRDIGLRDVIFASPPAGEAADREGAQVQIFSRGGYSVIRDTIHGRRVHLVFDHGPMGHTALSAHGHADALALWLTVDGQPVFVDAGTYLYHSGGAQRQRLRETGAHNTLMIGDTSAATANGAFGWNSRVDAKLVLARTGTNWAVCGEHSGYRPGFDATHVRRIEKDGDGIRIVDALSGASDVLPISLSFLCDPALDLAIEQGGVSVYGRDGMLITIAVPQNFTVETRDAPISGRFGSLSTTRRIVLSGVLGVGAIAETRLQPTHRLASITPLPGAAIAAASGARRGGTITHIHTQPETDHERSEP